MNTRKTGSARGDAKHEAHGAENPAAEAAMSRDVINIGQHVFKAAIDAYTEAEQDALEWLWGFAFDELHGSRSALCREIGYDWTVIFKIFTGQYGAKLDRFIESIERLKKRAAGGRAKLVDTIVTERIIEALDYAMEKGAMVMIQGPTGRSKTHTALAWCRDNNHGRAKYVRCLSTGSKRSLVYQLCRVCGIGTSGRKTADLEQRLFKSFDWRNTLVIDEAGFLVPRHSNRAAIEFVRDLHDACGCGVALIMTDVYVDEMRAGRHAAFFEQFFGRIRYPVMIPREVTKDEVRAAVASYRPDPPKDLLKTALKIARNRDGKLRTLFEDLRRAQDWADIEGRKNITAEDLEIASEWRLSGGVWPEE